ncbi:MAG: dihydrodipicolinate synthase family protein [Planctomycetota bacterium]
MKGLVAAPHTPMHSDLSLNLGMIEQQAAWLSNSGVVGVFFGGTTGEWSSLTTSERAELQSAWGGLDTNLKRVAHVGHNCQQDAIDLASHAGRVGVDAIAAVAPSFLKPACPDALAEYFAPIASAANALPFYVYHFPGLSHVKLAPVDQIGACARVIPSFAGLKYTDPDLLSFARCRAEFGDQFELMWGVDELLLGAMPFGVTAAVGSTYNYAAPLYIEMMDAFHRGDHDHAQACSMRVLELVDLLMAYDVLAAGKALMSLRGVECGPVRPPVVALSAGRRNELCQKVMAADMIDVITSDQGRSIPVTAID